MWGTGLGLAGLNDVHECWGAGAHSWPGGDEGRGIVSKVVRTPCRRWLEARRVLSRVSRPPAM